MERYKNTPVLFLLLALLCDCAAGNKPCSSNNVPDLTCYTDYNSTITCVWNSPDVSDQSENVCTIQSSGRNKFHNSFCNLELVDVSRPMPKKCTMNYRRGGNFQTFDKLSINLSCSHWKQSLIMIFKPSCHIKLKPPRQPAINFTTVSWTSRLTNETNESIESYSSQLQWKHEDESWSDRSVKIKDTQCEYHCTAELDPDQLVQEEKYQARTRVKAISEGTESMWSDWSPSTPWVSLIGRTRPAPPPSDKDPTGGVFGIVAAAAGFAVFLVVIRIKTDKTTWVYVAKKIKGPPLPNPANSFLNDANFQNWLSPYFTSESFQSFFKPVDIVSVEVTSTVDAVAPYGPEAALLEKIRSEDSHESTSSNFSNPSYSKLCPSPPSPPSPPPVSSLTAGNLAPCATDTPYGPIGSQGQGNNAEQDREARGKEVEIR
ncbi:interleukin-21 receptor, partial [Etheostoma spectabile]|uniref:interleukin-21 receptor n=1 Tax=Etheostoma spectabile TaxID=54343 RepID=UPI0013AE9DBC